MPRKAGAAVAVKRVLVRCATCEGLAPQTLVLALRREPAECFTCKRRRRVVTGCGGCGGKGHYKTTCPVLRGEVAL